MAWTGASCGVYCISIWLSMSKKNKIQEKPQTFYLKRSTRKDKKYQVTFSTPKGQKTVHFGARGYYDFTKHKDPKRKESYIARHGNNNENWEDAETAGFWALHLLWNKETIEESITDIENRHKKQDSKKDRDKDEQDSRKDKDKDKQVTERRPIRIVDLRSDNQGSKEGNHKLYVA